jgi:hypothetical protein
VSPNLETLTFRGFLEIKGFLGGQKINDFSFGGFMQCGQKKKMLA